MKRPPFRPCLVLGLTLFTACAALAQEPPREEPDERTAKYLEALVRRPSGGPLFDRFYNAWLDTGSVAGLEAYLAGRAQADDASAADALLLAWFHAKRGDDNQALASFRKALDTDPGNAEAWLEKAKAESRLLDFETALVDLDRALAANPKEALLIEATKLKGRLLSRNGRGEEALVVWRTLAEEHADDEDLQEDLVDLHLAEGLDAEAVALMEKLVASTRDTYQRVTRQLRLGGLLQRGGEREKAIALYDASLDTAGRDTWLETEILSQLERAFRREDDLAGLRDHLAAAIGKDSGRTALRKRHAAVLAELEETDAAVAAFTEILRLTPGDRANREAFVALLGRIGRPAEAAEQMAALATQHPGDAELHAQLALWRHSAGQADEARASVDEFLKASDGSEYAHLRAARLLEQFDATEAASGLYQRMVETFPNSLEAKEAQAEFLHRSGKTDEAIAIWKGIAADGSGSDAHRAARALASRGEHESAYEILKSRVDEFATDFAYLGQLGAEAVALEKHDEALAWAEQRLALARSSIDLNEAMRQILPLLERLEKTGEHRAALAAKTGRTLAETCLLAEMLERNGQFDEAEAVLAPELEAGDVLAITQQVRLFSSREEWVRAAETQRLLVERPGGRDSANVQELVRLFGRAARYDEALRWIGEWKKLSPGATQPWAEQASVLLQMDQPAEAIATLKAAVRKFETSVELRAQLARLHLGEGQHAEAERLCWALYEESEDLSQQLGWVGQLAEIAADAGRTGQLVEQFEERRRTNRTSLAPLLAIAEIHRRDGNSEARREALLEATKMRPEDLKLLHEIARIEEQEGDWEAARTTLESALPLDKTRGTKERIALLVMRYGDEEEGYRRLAELSGEAADADAVLGLADAMIGRADWERVAAYLAEQRPRFPDDYRLAYLHGIALVEDQRIGEAQPFFLELLDWKTEIAKAAANPAVPTISRSLSDYYKGLPEGVSDLYVATAKAYPAFQYRQALQQSAGQYRSQLIRQGGGRLVPLPSSLLDLRSSAITHLAALGQGLDDEERTRLGEAMLARGVKSGDLLLEIPLPNPHRGNYPEFPAELLDRHPDRLDLWAKAVIDQSYQSPATIDAAMMARCYEKFREDYPMLAFCAAVRAAASGAEEGAALLDQALAEQPPLEEKDSAGAIRIPLQTLSSSLAPATPFRGQQQTFLPDRFRAPLIERYLRYLDIVRKDTTVQKQATTANFFDATDEYGWLLRGLDDLDPYADHLDAEIARYEEMRRSEPVAKAGQSTLLRQIPWIVHDRPLFTEPSFPPLELPGFPPNVLVQFATLPNYPAPNSIPTEAAVRQIDRVRSPVLRALFAHLAGDKDRAEKEIEAFLGEVTIDPATRLQRLLLGASWFGTVRENPARAIALLDEARSLTTDKDMRRTIDSFLVSFARKAASGDTEKKDEALLAAGREAALRLRYGLVGPQHRGELTAALIELGLEGEAEQLQQKSVAKASPAITRTAVAATAPPDLYDRVKKLADDGKMEEAVKLATQNLRPALRAYGGSMGGNVQLDYQLIQFLQRLNSQKPLLEEIKTAFDPGDPAAAEPSALLEWATFQLLLGEFEPALASYLAAQGKLPEHKQDSVKAKVAAILSFTDPGNAAPQLAGFDDKTLAQCFAEQQALRQIRNYFGYDRADTFRQKLNIARTFALWIESLGEDALQRLDLTPADSVLRFEVTDQIHGDIYLPGLFRDVNPQSSWRRSQEETKSAAALAATRREVHDTLCLALLRSPQYARAAFSSLIGLRLREDADAALADPENRERALLALRSTAARYRGAPGQPSNYYSTPNYPETARWLPEEFLLLRAAKNGDAEAAAEAMKTVEATKQRDLAAATRVFHDLASGDAESFAAAAKKYLGPNSTGPNPYTGNNRPYASDEALAMPEKLLVVWEARGDTLKEFDMDAFAADLAKRADAVSTLPLTLLAERAIRAGEPDLARQRLDALALALLGERKKWGEFKREGEQRVSTGSGSYYIQGGEFTRPEHQLYAALMQRLCNQPDTLFAGVAYLHENGLDTNGQVTSGTLLSGLATPRLSEDPELAVALLDNPFFFGPAERFSTLDLGRVNVLRSCLDQIRKSGPAKTKVREAAAAKGTYGGDLVAAYLSEQPKAALADALGKHRAAIEARLDDAARADLAAFVNAVYGDGGADYESLNADARTVLEALGTARQKSAKEAAVEFLAAKDIRKFNVNNDTDLERLLAPLMQPLWAAEDWDTATAVYWHGVDLVRTRIRSGDWPSYTTSGWNLEGDVLNDIMNAAPGSDLGRVALFHRILLGDKEARIPHYFSGMGFDADLRNALDRAGGEAKLEEALDALALELHTLCGEESATLLGGHLQTMIFNFRPPLILRALA